MIDQAELKEILEQHKLWIQGNGGKKADLSFADLSFANLRSANLRSADLSFADLSSADLSFANLRSANLRSADLRSANLRSADLSSADLSFANLRSADLRSANLRSADLSSADLSFANLRSADLIVVQLGQYAVYAQKEFTRIGCEYHKNTEWLNWGVDDVRQMAHDASAWWEQYKPMVVCAIKTITNNSGENR